MLAIAGRSWYLADVVYAGLFLRSHHRVCHCRCVREDEQSATVRCHYLTDGTVNFAFTIRRAEFFIPAGVLLKCFMEMSDKEIFDKICKAATVVSPHTLQQPCPYIF